MGRVIALNKSKIKVRNEVFSLPKTDLLEGINFDDTDKNINKFEGENQVEIKNEKYLCIIQSL